MTSPPAPLLPTRPSLIEGGSTGISVPSLLRRGVRGEVSGSGGEVAPGVYWCDSPVVNVYFIGKPGGQWVMVDTGTPFHFEALRAAAEARFGKNTRPEAIYLTHGHRDHAGSALALAAYYDVPVYAHRMELPYLTGRADYPPYDSTVGGAFGLVAPFITNRPLDLGEWIHELPAGDLPGLEDWQVIETPGHTPGHISFYRATDGVLLAGDACATVDLDYHADLITRKQRVSKPPTPATPDWVAVRKSARKLAALKPRVLACGHGIPMSGLNVATDLFVFAEHFVPPLRGRYVADPAQFDENGVTFLPSKPKDSVPKAAVALGIAVAIGAVWYFAPKKRTEK